MNNVINVLRGIGVEDAHNIYEIVKGMSHQDLLELNLAFSISNHLKLKRIIMNLDEILAKVQAQKTVEDSIVTLLNETNSELKAAIASGDQAKLQQISDSLDANTKELSDAVVANTPAAAASTADVSNTGS